jgi:NDP-sugar pyrophosphorylase family protein
MSGRQVVVMAGGKGARLTPYTQDVPKPLLPLSGRPMIEILLRRCARHGIANAIISIGHMGDKVRAALSATEIGMAISFVNEDSPLGTCGILGTILERLDPNFILVNGDLLSDIHFGRLFEYHLQNDADATVGAFQLETAIPYGVLAIDGEANVKRYDEKPTRAFDVSMGAYALRREAILPFFDVPGVARDAPDMIRFLIETGRKVIAFRDASFWIDVGTPPDYVRAADLVAAHPELVEDGA